MLLNRLYESKWKSKVVFIVLIQSPTTVLKLYLLTNLVGTKVLNCETSPIVMDPPKTQRTLKSN